MLQWLLSLIPWWLYVAGNGAIAAAIWLRFGSRPAVIFAALALVWVAYDKGGDDRAAYLKQKAESDAQGVIERANRARERSDAVPVGRDGVPDDGWRRPD